MLKLRRETWSVALVATVVIGCSDRVTRDVDVVPMTIDDPAVLEPGFVSLPPLAKWRPPVSVPSCHPIAAEASASPAIEFLSSGGPGGGLGNMQIFEDGTVLFDGGGCPNGGRRRGKMAAARVGALLDKLEKTGFFGWPCSQEVPCNDAFITSLTVHRGRHHNTVRDSSCNSNPTDISRAIELVMHTVGKNACSPACRETPALASCN
jgi:hypothetical protein